MRDIEKNGTKEGSGIQVTVMNERSQAGAATLQKGMIEFIHNRRLLFDDDRGVGEPLMETDAQGYGLKVNARYWLNIFDLTHSFSAQRPLQNFIDKPHSLFFAKISKEDISKTEEVKASEPSMLPLLLNDYVNDITEFEYFGRMVMFPLWKDMILVRIQNSADKFDMHSPTLKVNMEKFAEVFWQSANPTAGKFEGTPHILEVSISANMAEKEIMHRREKMQWKGQDDAQIKEMLE